MYSVKKIKQYKILVISYIINSIKFIIHVPYGVRFAKISILKVDKNHMRPSAMSR